MTTHHGRSPGHSRSCGSGVLFPAAPENPVNERLWMMKGRGRDAHALWLWRIFKTCPLWPHSWHLRSNCAPLGMRGRFFLWPLPPMVPQLHPWRLGGPTLGGRYPSLGCGARALVLLCWVEFLGTWRCFVHPWRLGESTVWGDDFPPLVVTCPPAGRTIPHPWSSTTPPLGAWLRLPPPHAILVSVFFGRGSHPSPALRQALVR